MTPKRKGTLQFIRAYFDAHSMAPTLNEIAADQGVCITTAHHHIGKLLRDGHLVRLGRGRRCFAPATLWLSSVSTEELRTELARREASNG